MAKYRVLNIADVSGLQLTVESSSADLACRFQKDGTGEPQTDVMNSIQTSLKLIVIALTSYHSVLKTPSLRSARCDGDGYHLCM